MMRAIALINIKTPPTVSITCTASTRSIGISPIDPAGHDDCAFLGRSKGTMAERALKGPKSGLTWHLDLCEGGFAIWPPRNKLSGMPTAAQSINI